MPNKIKILNGGGSLSATTLPSRCHVALLDLYFSENMEALIYSCISMQINN